LQETGELTVQTSNTGTKITVNNYANYQVTGSSVMQNVSHELNNELHNGLNTTKNIKKERSIKKLTKKVKVEILPSYYNAEPVRITEPIPATEEEIEALRKQLQKGK
jgi:hypothetical protein